MNKKISLYFLISFFFISILPTYAAIKKSPKDLPQKYRKWLEEDVVYIIKPKEKDVLLELETDKERDIFIEAFWKVRDPNPNTPDNEFKKEHYRRIGYANQWFGRESPTPGWKTDMGRIYIILGEPKSIDKFDNLSEVYPMIIWFYQGMFEYGLPNAFYVAFFKKQGVGEYQLYSPIRFGPQELLVHYSGDQTQYADAYNELLKIEPLIAEVSMSLLPGETDFSVNPSLASELLLANKIPSAPLVKVKDDYAEKLLKYKDIVEVEYTANYMDNDSLIRVISDKSGISFVHYLVEPKKLSVEQYEDKFQTNLEINGKISDLKGNTIYQFERKIPIELNEDQLGKIKAKLFSFQDMFPLIEGNYKFNLLLKNFVSKEFTSVEADVTVPETSSLRMSPLLLANRIVKNSEYRGKNKPFLIGNVQLVPSPRNDFSLQDNLYLFFQIQGLSDELKEEGSLECSILKDGIKIRSVIKNVKDYPDKMNFIEEFPLSNLVSAAYKIKVSLFDKNHSEILFEQADFYISPTLLLPRPWVLSIPMPPSDDPLYSNALGNQLLNNKDLEKSVSLLEEAHSKDSSSAKFALDLCRVLFLRKEYQRVKEIGTPFLKDQENYEFLGLLGQSCQALGEYADAISYYKDHLAHYGTNINVLNSIGDCYYKLGNTEEALVAWEKSLQLKPGQEKIKKIVESIKNKK
jgi:GWxTD domain-containing protein